MWDGLMDRRAFLHPGCLFAGAQAVAEALAPAESQAEDSDVPPLVRYRRPAMGTCFEVVLPWGTPQAHAAAEAALDLIDALEARLSIYREDSELSRLNRLAFHEEVQVSPELFDLLELSREISQQTQGAFDVASGALVACWGFFRGPARVPSAQQRQDALQRSGMRYVVLDRANRTVRYLRPGLSINLGSIGKGYALDRCAALLQQEFGVRCALLHGGHSSVNAVGSLPGRGDGWPVGISDPRAPTRRLTLIRLKDQGLGMSAATYRHLLWRGRRLGHILDPRTGWPAQGLAGVAVVAPQAAQADALATALFVLGDAAARRFLEHRPDLAAILVCQDRRRCA
jgi:thiamine biosynthesis lipoprotein